MLLTYKENVHSTQMYIPLKPLFSRHKGIGVQFTDEPTGNLDKKSSEDVLDLLTQLCADNGCTLILVTHDKSVADRMGRIITISDGEISED